MPEARIAPEQAARDMLERMGVENAQSFTSGEVVELANLLNAVGSFTRDDVALIRAAAHAAQGDEHYFVRALRDSLPDEDDLTDVIAKRYEVLADRLAALLPPDDTAPPLRLERGDPRTFEQKLNDAL